jgi:exopolyphosphatase/guanosine-5'-triphosphate,3'-diphosphate pyrophosphatase
MEKFPNDDPPTHAQLASCRKFVRDFLGREVRPKLEPFLKKSAARLIGTGGTATILARMQLQLAEYDRAKIEGTRMDVGQIRTHAERLWGMPLEERKKITGLPKSRADVILPGVVIYEGVMETLGFDQLCISTRGLRYAAVM